MKINEEIVTHMMCDNLETLAHELGVANITIEEQVEDRDVQKDYFSSIEIVQLIVKSLQWTTYIDRLQATIEAQNYSELNKDLKKLTELQQYITLITNIVKEHM